VIDVMSASVSCVQVAAGTVIVVFCAILVSVHFGW
jgi:hypothetical protein